MAGERGTHTKPAGMKTVEVATYEEERVGMSGQKLVLVVRQRNVNGIITVWWTVQNTYEQKVGAERKP